ncbi:OmpA family protein [Micromonospora zamorensis]|uniref:OmpA family protein n=1 Tax=Micromonospora zamorensis TaxID=709883 RepID=UPI002E1EAA40
MFRSVSGRTALAATALTLLLVSEPVAAWSAPTPTPTSGTAVVPGPTLAAGARVDAPIIDILAPTDDIYLRTEDLDGNSLEAESGGRIELILAADVLFAFGKADLSAAARTRLAEIAERLRAEATGTVQIFGHTDAVGDDAQNLALSLRRAEAVRAVLSAEGGSQVTYEIKGFGETRPVAPNTLGGKDNPKGRASNRRVEIRFDK